MTMIDAFLARKQLCELKPCTFERFLIRNQVRDKTKPVKPRRRMFTAATSRSLVDILNKCTADNAYRMAVKYVQHSAVTDADLTTVIDKMVMHHEFVKVYMPVLNAIGDRMQDLLQTHIAKLQESVCQRLTDSVPNRIVLAQLEVLIHIAPSTRYPMARLCATQMIAHKHNPDMLELLLQSYKLLDCRSTDVIIFLSDNMRSFDNRCRFVAMDIV